MGMFKAAAEAGVSQGIHKAASGHQLPPIGGTSRHGMEAILQALRNHPYLAAAGGLGALGLGGYGAYRAMSHDDAPAGHESDAEHLPLV